GGEPAVDRPLQPPPGRRGRPAPAVRGGPMRSFGKEPAQHRDTEETQRKQTCFSVLCYLGVAVSLWFSSPTPAADWPLFRGNPLQTGVAAAPLPAPLEILWKYKTKDSIEGAAALVKDTVYVG